MLNTMLVKDKMIKETKPADNHGWRLSNYFHTAEPAVIKTVHFPERKKRTRLVVKKGAENIFLLLDNIVLFYTEKKIVYVIDHAGKKYMADETLAALENELESSTFFRANRQYIININYIRSFRAYEKVKLKVDMNSGELNDQYFIIISEETTPAFKKWIYSA